MSTVDAGLILSRVVIKIFAKHHSGQIAYIRGDKDFKDFGSMSPSDSSFWDRWKPCKFCARATNVRLEIDYAQY
jgi:hypothetical protein